jgi:hypothetical protein
MARDCWQENPQLNQSIHISPDINQQEIDFQVVYSANQAKLQLLPQRLSIVIEAQEISNSNLPRSLQPIHTHKLGYTSNALSALVW